MSPRVGVMDMRQSLQIFGRAGDSGMGPADIKFGSAQTITGGRAVWQSGGPVLGRMQDPKGPMGQPGQGSGHGG
jgi:hypothetical protein